MSQQQSVSSHAVYSHTSHRWDGRMRPLTLKACEDNEHRLHAALPARGDTSATSRCLWCCSSGQTRCGEAIDASVWWVSD